MRRWAAWTGLLGVAIAAGWGAARLLDLVRADAWLPFWDLAGHGLTGLDVSRSIKHLDPLAFLDTLNRQSTWPFFNSLLLAPFFLALGDDYVTSNIANTVFYALAIVAIFSAGVGLHGRRGAWVGACAAALALTSPAFALFGTVTMLEIPGALLMALAVAFHAQACRREGDRSWLIASGLTATALFFCKYNYGLLWLLPLAAFEAGLHRAVERQAWVEALRQMWRRGVLWRPIPLLVLGFGAFAAAILITGGFEIAIHGKHVSVRSPANAAMVVYFVIVASFIWSLARNPARWLEAWRRLPMRVRVLAGVVLLPIGIWFLIPPHLSEFVRFLVNRSGDTPQPWTLERLLYYPLVFIREYSPAPWVGVLVFLLALTPRPPRDEESRLTRDPATLLTMALGVDLVATMIHRYQQPRFLFTTAVLIWLRASMIAVAWLEYGFTRARTRNLTEAIWGVALALLVVVPYLAGPSIERIRADRRSVLAPPGFGAVLDTLLTNMSMVERRGVLLGVGVQLSPSLLAWHAEIRHSHSLRVRLPNRLPWLQSNASEEAIGDRIERLRAAGAPVFSALPWSAEAIAGPGIRQEVAADSITSERLMRDAGVSVVVDEMVPNTGYRFRVFRFH